MKKIILFFIRFAIKTILKRKSFIIVELIIIVMIFPGITSDNAIAVLKAIDEIKKGNRL